MKPGFIVSDTVKKGYVIFSRLIKESVAMICQKNLDLCHMEGESKENT